MSEAVGNETRSAALLTGQMYLVDTSATTIDGSSVVVASYAVLADSAESAASRLAYFVDIAQYARFAIKRVVRIKPNFHCISSRTYDVDDEKPFVELNGQTLHYSRTNRQADRDFFAVGIAGKIKAKSREHALRRLGYHLSNVATANETESPLADGVIHVDEIGAGSLETMARDVSHWKQAHMISVASTG